ncbi:molecular chaperone DjiA [Salaquimonas pukyongi]|uniref:molecular chaperone DjiA n=1 Tax=Salaquimonas pukyongi TaxID=2712698 RepID=UPI00096B7A2F|nr:molecular chaperone DjiA [Salaquimonas pukyongi]
MSIWANFGEFIASTASQAFSAVVESVRTVFEGDPATRKQVTFSIAIIALSAKMAKADGIVTQEEVTAFQELFEVPQKEAANVARVYNLAKQDVAGFESYASQVKALFPEEEDILRDVLDGLFHIAKADGVIHERELGFVETVSDIFGLGHREFEGLRLRHMEPEEGDPYLVLGADPNWDNERLKAHYRKLVRDNHPDRMLARGVPEEFLRIANDRLAGINLAWQHLCRERGI